MKSKEKKYEKRARLFVEGNGGLLLKTNPAYFNGLPDRQLNFPGLISPIVEYVEFKDEGLQPTPLQLHVHGILRRMGFTVWVVNSATTLEIFLNRVKQLRSDL